MQNEWRLAFMFDAPGGDLAALENNLINAASEIRRLAGEAHVRLGVADYHPDLATASATVYDTITIRTVHGAIEISVSDARKTELPTIAQAVKKIVNSFIEPGSLEVMTGPYFPMVPVREGDAFLSLTFCRDPAITQEQFQRWWHDQHAGIAIPILGAGLLAYDQVHVDTAATAELAAALGMTPVSYDAYDNLTWADRYEYLTSTADPEGMRRTFQDELGNIDNSSRRGTLMRKVG